MTAPRVLVVTGTDTGVGKTVVTAAIAVCRGLAGSVAVLKPAQTGVLPGEPGDLDEVRRLSGATSLHEGVRLRDPLAPTAAARREGVRVPDVAAHAETVHRLARTHDTVVVEGAGGVLVGLDGAGATLRDLAALLEEPPAFVVVCRAGLGTLNHSALTVEALRGRGLTVAGLVIGARPAHPDLAEQENLHDLPLVTGVPLLGALPDGAGRLSRQAFSAAAPTWLRPPLR